MIPISRPIITEEETAAVLAVLKSGQIVQGPVVEKLEQRFAELCGTKYAIAVNSGTAALHAAVHAIGIEPGDEVITTPFTFVASANCLLMAGAAPVFVDVDEKTFNINPARVEEAITPKTKAILAVNLYGQCADYEALSQIARKHGLKIVEDAAQSVAATFQGKTSGNLGDVGCFSLYATKNLTSGEGGVITTNDPDIYERALLFRHHGQKKGLRYEYYGLGYNYRLSDLHAAIAVTQMKRLSQMTQQRRENAARYTEAFQGLAGLITPVEASGSSHVFHQYTLRITDRAKQSRDELQTYLEKKAIQTQIYYPKALYDFPHLSAGKKEYDYSVTDKLTGEVISLPVHPLLSKDDVASIIENVINFFK